MIEINIVIEKQKIKYKYNMSSDTMVYEIALAITYLELLKKWLLESLEEPENLYNIEELDGFQN